MHNDTFTMPEYKFSEKIEYNKPIPPHLLYEEESCLPKSRVCHLKNLAQLCSKYSQEFDMIFTSIPPSSITSLLNTSLRTDADDFYEMTNDEFQTKRKSKLVIDQERELEIRPSLKKKKKTKKLKKLSKKLNKTFELTPNEEENIDGSQEKIEQLQIKTFSNSPYNVNTNELANLLIIQNKIVNEKKTQRFKPYEKPKLPNIDTTSVQHIEQIKANSQYRTCPWLINGKTCGRHFATDDLFNDHIKSHTTESIFTDLKFYFQAKNLLNPKSFREVW